MKRTKDDKTWASWKRNRRKTIVGYIIVGIVVGIDYSVIFSTLYLYLRDTIKTNNVNAFYGLTIAAYSLSSSLFGVVAGRLVDRTRRVKLYTTITLLLQIVGAILYVIPFHVAFPLAGRFIAGTGDAFSNVCTGEIVRIYNEKDGTRALWWLASCYSVGLIIGPVLPLIFNGIRFKLGPILVNEYNFIGIFMASLLCITICVANFLIHDCSSELDLKQYLKEHNIDDISDIDQNGSIHHGDIVNDIITRNVKETLLPNNEIPDVTAEVASENNNIPSASYTLKQLLSNYNTALLLVSTFICMYCMFAVDVLIPLIILVILEWNLVSLVVFLILSGFTYALILFVMSKFCNSNFALYSMMQLCMVAGLFMFLAIIAIKYKERCFTVDVVLVVLLGMFWLLMSCIEEVLIRALLAKMVSSHVQSFVETFRNGISSVATILAALTSALVLSFIQWWALSLMFVISFLLLAHIVRGSSLIYPREIGYFSVTTEQSGNPAS